ncbi:aminoglycoside phosphotransferase family protein [Marichromatium gracile]|uniref:Aminoglycoside phosphotransferase n=1 Tax=Marichromatium gracile TaxID=1048 RepID=A0ABR5VH81_MARGR|nr:phosphotransferase [Marichromatium gracile]KXX64681.1 aminoglycoside phosphotransferase [Marichromatium gracile]
MADRDAALHAWLDQVLEGAPFQLTPASADASFRRYLRVHLDDRTLIAMDAPPEHEDCGRFARLARRLCAAGLNAPEVHAAATEQGFLLLDDLGERPYLQVLDETNADRLYGEAMDALLTLQTAVATDDLPRYDAAFLGRELGLFRDWFLERHLGRAPDAATTALLDALDRVLIDSALEQPQVCVHRDYHSRNLMWLAADNPGVLDFQDAVLGPLTYDLVSLLRDAYISWPEARVEGWALDFRRHALARGVLPAASPGGRDPAHFLRWFDLMGVQRHLKVCGIFARLALRDGKRQYLDDLPRVLDALRTVAARHPELAGLARLLDGL